MPDSRLTGFIAVASEPPAVSRDGEAHDDDARNQKLC